MANWMADIIKAPTKQSLARWCSRGSWRTSASPSPPAEGGEGRGEEALLWGMPLSPALSPLVPRGERGTNCSLLKCGIRLRQPAYPTALEAASDGAAGSLSRRTGEGQGEGRFVGNTPPVLHLFLHKP